MVSYQTINVMINLRQVLATVLRLVLDHEESFAYGSSTFNVYVLMVLPVSQCHRIS